MKDRIKVSGKYGQRVEQWTELTTAEEPVWILDRILKNQNYWIWQNIDTGAWKMYNVLTGTTIKLGSQNDVISGGVPEEVSRDKDRQVILGWHNTKATRII